MYTDEELNDAVKKGIFTDSSVAEFRALVSSSRSTAAVDEENFRLIGGFNDIFIVIACALLLFSALWVLKAIDNGLGLSVFTLLSWGLAEYFVRKRKMALPAIMLLLSFVGGVFALCINLLPPSSETSFAIAAAITAVAAYLHWRRFNVPITVAAGTAAAIGFLMSATISIFPNAENWNLLILFVYGLVTFLVAMHWDSSDVNRTTRRSDVGFWLHLLSAPLIIHPVFSSLGILSGNEGLTNMAVVIVLYVVMTSISIAVDRRAFMLSSLAYVLYALSTLVKTYGGVGYSFAITGVFVGGALLLLSAYWHRVRANLVTRLPGMVQNYLPKAHSSGTPHRIISG
ncbi:MAG: hypothetical protein GY703_01690 [Gammaproteobacteria bacterium]|nr:hypothetical protein [Gammaproteobacteria bacterium]